MVSTLISLNSPLIRLEFDLANRFCYDLANSSFPQTFPLGWQTQVSNFEGGKKCGVIS